MNSAAVTEAIRALDGHGADRYIKQRRIAIARIASEINHLEAATLLGPGTSPE
jgi:hypothetical protein